MTYWNDATKYLRIAALAWFLYDWALTLPAEIRLYRKQTSFWRPSIACLLLILGRYLGLIALLANIIGFFAHFFPDDPNPTCKRYFHAMPIIQCLASWASLAIFVVRTSAICTQTTSPRLGFIFLAMATAGLQLFSQIYSFFKYQVGTTNNCLIQYDPDRNFGWLYYAAATTFDIIIVISTYRGLQIRHLSTAKVGNKPRNFNGLLWNSSIVYFGVVTFWNMLNLAFYAVYDNSNATVLCAIGIAMTSMMSVRVILDMHDYADKRASSLKLDGINVSDASHRARPASSSFWGVPSHCSQSSVYSSMPTTPTSAYMQRQIFPIDEKLRSDYSASIPPSTRPTSLDAALGTKRASELPCTYPNTGIRVTRTVDVYEPPESWETRWERLGKEGRYGQGVPV